MAKPVQQLKSPVAWARSSSNCPRLPPDVYHRTSREGVGCGVSASRRGRDRLRARMAGRFCGPGCGGGCALWLTGRGHGRARH